MQLKSNSIIIVGSYSKQCQIRRRKREISPPKIGRNCIFHQIFGHISKIKIQHLKKFSNFIAQNGALHPLLAQTGRYSLPNTQHASNEHNTKTYDFPLLHSGVRKSYCSATNHSISPAGRLIGNENPNHQICTRANLLESSFLYYYECSNKVRLIPQHTPIDAQVTKETIK